MQVWRPAVTDPHNVRPCNCTDVSPSNIAIDPEGFRTVSIGHL